ncbi:MAG: sodium:solute symporter [Bacteroidia bacterium]|jgi:SSS family solute:Na+ symporter
MSTVDYIVLILTLVGIVAYGVYKSRSSRDIEGYFLGNRSMPWFLVLLSIMGTQASAITFLSGPGQAYSDGMRFVQYYFGLPLAMIVISIWLLPVFSRLNIVTAYEYLEQRFDRRVRTVTSLLFLVSRGLSTGVSIYAPSLILSTLFGWNIYLTNAVMGGILIIYTVSGGAKAVAYTQQIQLFIIFGGLILAGILLVNFMPAEIGFLDALHVGGSLGKMNIITTGFESGSFDWSDKYNIWSGLIGGFFLALSYFGTDQSQVGRYLTARSLAESRMGLLMNGFVKVPMQFLILILGVLVFSFYQFTSAPVFFNGAVLEKAKQGKHADSLLLLEHEYERLSSEKTQLAKAFSDQVKPSSTGTGEDVLLTLQMTNDSSNAIRNQVKKLIRTSEMGLDANDNNYVFLRFVIDYLPQGLVGLLIAIIFLAAWGSIAAALNSLASSTMVDLHMPFKGRTNEYNWSKFYTLMWGLFCVLVACFASEIGNSLIEAVNILGSLFYGTLLGIFVTALAFKKVRAQAVLAGIIVSQAAVIAIFCFSNISFLWYNVIGCVVVMTVAWVMENIRPKHINT